MLATAFGQNPAPQSFQTQPPNEDVTIRINVNLVQVDAVVTDSKGKQVSDLKAGDFEILQDGKPQVITNFGYITSRPAGGRTVPVVAPKPGPGAPPPPPPTRLKPGQVRRTVALVVDDLGLSFESMARTRSAIKKWVDEQMQPGDMVAVVRTGAGMGALQQFTAEKRMLYAAIERCRFNPFGRTSIGTFAMMGDELDAEGRMDEFRETQFSVGTLGAITYVVSGLRELPGRKSILLFSEHMRMFNSEGSNAQVMERMRSLTDAANRASVVIYTIDPRGLETLQLTAADNVSGMSQEQLNNQQSRRVQQNWESKDGLAFLAQETGGLFLDNNNDIYGGVRQVMEDLEGYYLIGYHPDASTFDEKKGLRPYHSVKVRVKRAGLRVRSRNGFYGVSDQEVRPRVGRSRDEQLAHALVSPFGSAEIGLRLTTLYSHIPKDSLKPVAKAARDAGFELQKARSAQKKDRKTIREATEKYARLTEMSKTENYINSLLHIQAKDLRFVDEEAADKEGKKETWKKAIIDILAINFGDNGQEIDRSNTTYTIRVKGETYKDVMANGFIYSHRHPIRKPGAYQLRVALRDATSQKLGSATQFIEVPDVNKGRLTLSGLVLKGEIPAPKTAPGVAPGVEVGYSAASQMEGKVDAPDPKASPAVRIFKPGRPLTYGYQVMNAQPGPSKVPQLEVQTRVFRDGKQVYEGKPMPFVAAGQKDPKNLIAGGRLQLGGRMAPGDYVLQVIVVDKLAKDKHRTASQWMDFVVEP